MNLSLNSGAKMRVPYHIWYLPVGLLCPINLPLSRHPTPVSSWEFLTTLGYEISIIRGCRPYRWTIWVRIGGLFLCPPLPTLQPWTK